MKNIFFSLTVFLLSTLSFNAFSQGCSDAGICSAGSLFGGEELETKHNTIRLNMGFGAGVDNTMIYTPSIEGRIKLGKSTNLQLQLPYVFTSGELGSANGLGDLITTVTQNLYKMEDLGIDLSLGFRIGTNNANKKEDGKALPMVYQTSLGTFDLLSGVSVVYKKWHFAIGYQQPLDQYNENSYDPRQWPGKDLEDYSQSNQLERKPDLMLRAEYGFDLGEKSKLSAGILPILHLGKDTYLNPVTNKREDIDGSEGLTFNLTGNWVYQINDTFDFMLGAGVPIIARDYNPDGLKRAFVINPSLIYKF